MEAPIGASDNKLGIMQDPMLPPVLASMPTYEFERPVEIPTGQVSTSHGMDTASVTANEAERSIYDNWPLMQLSFLPTPSNQEGSNYPAFSNTLGEGLDGHNLRSTDDRQIVATQCSGDLPVEHGHSEPNVDGRAYESMAEPYASAVTWTNDSMQLPIAPEQPTPSTSQIQGHIPNCMGGLGLSVTRERKRWRKDKGIRFVNLSST
ncbi:hypothetical protein JR316_0002910 [Psilocybe cubensis]|nr:hypothetical protein JR316_0002910 [Psilocybe cubensis]KAH9483442.1 hypothetical protein JR316_0002910 [Psilocybe cubensis]